MATPAASPGRLAKAGSSSSNPEVGELGQAIKARLVEEYKRKIVWLVVIVAIVAAGATAASVALILKVGHLHNNVDHLTTKHMVIRQQVDNRTDNNQEMTEIKDRLVSTEFRVCGCGHVASSVDLTGPRGADANNIIWGTSPPTTEGSSGDLYIDTAAQRLYHKDQAWSEHITLGISGPPGPQGPAGRLGPQGPTGPQGADGDRILWGTNVPGSQGSSGDIYIDTTTQKLYRKNETWDESTTLGWPGLPGPSGAMGPQGPIGLTGEQGDAAECRASCPSHQQQNCCGSECKQCPYSMTCRSGQCTATFNTSRCYDGLCYSIQHGDYTYDKCQALCQSAYFANGTTPLHMVFVTSYEHLVWVSNQFVYQTWLAYKWNGTNFVDGDRAMTYMNWRGGVMTPPSGEDCVVKSLYYEFLHTSCSDRAPCLCSG